MRPGDDPKRTHSQNKKSRQVTKHQGLDWEGLSWGTGTAVSHRSTEPGATISDPVEPESDE